MDKQILLLLIFGIVVVSIIATLFLGWYYYQKARDKERMYLLERGESLDEIFQIQRRNKFKFIFPWLKVGIVTSGMSVAFFIIALLVFWLEKDFELFKGFLITTTFGVCLSASFIINHFVGKYKKNNDG